MPRGAVRCPIGHFAWICPVCLSTVCGACDDGVCQACEAAEASMLLRPTSNTIQPTIIEDFTFTDEYGKVTKYTRTWK